MKPVALVFAVPVFLIFGPPVLGPGTAVAQQMQPHDAMMTHGTMLEGMITQIRFVSCGGTPQSCQAIIQIAPTPKGEMASGGAMMQGPAETGGGMMMEHPVTIIVVPGTALMSHGSTVPLTRLKVGDHITCEYVTTGGMNVVTSVMMADMGHM
jgi:hypothetical protein